MISPGMHVKVTRASVFIKSSLTDSNVHSSSENHQHAVLSQLYCTEKDGNKIHKVLHTLLESGINRQFYPSLKHYFSKLLIVCIHYIYHFKRGSFFKCKKSP